MTLQAPRKTAKDFACESCGGFFDCFSLLDSLWADLAPRQGGRGLLCLPCCQEKLGRPLQPEDFKAAAPVNRGLLLMFQNGRNSVK